MATGSAWGAQLGWGAHPQANREGFVLTQSPTARARARRWFWAAVDVAIWAGAIFAMSYLRYDVLNGKLPPRDLFEPTLILALSCGLGQLVSCLLYTSRCV